MEISVFSVLMTVLWSSILIAFFYLGRTKTRLLYICSISTVILLYLFCAVRVVLPIELPWTRVVSGGAIFNTIRDTLFYQIGFVRFYELFITIWMIGMGLILSKYLVQYRRVTHYIHTFQREESMAILNVLDSLEKGSRIEVFKTTQVKSPCCLGIFKKRILLPDKEYDRKELQYILLHEYTHLHNNDILLKTLITVLCGIYWWNPIVYLLRKDLNQSMEIRCDLSVSKYLNENERADYLSVMLDAFRESRQTEQYVGVAGLVENHSASLLERFQIVADRKIVQKNRASVFAAFMMLVVLVISYSFIFQSKYETPMSEIETDTNVYSIDAGNAYITKQGNTYILHVAGTKTEMSEDAVKILLEEGVTMKGGD